MQDVKIYLKSGQVFEIPTEGIEKTTHNQTGELMRLAWSGIDGEEKLFYVDLNYVAAITVKERQPEE